MTSRKGVNLITNATLTSRTNDTAQTSETVDTTLYHLKLHKTATACQTDDTTLTSNAEEFT